MGCSQNSGPLLGIRYITAPIISRGTKMGPLGTTLIVLIGFIL